MKAKVEDLGRLKALSPDIRLFLLAGPDEATAEALGARLIALAGRDAERVDIAGEKLKDSPERLAVEAASMSLFNSARVIRLSIAGAGDDALAAVEALLAAPVAPSPVVAIAPAMSARAKVMKLAEGSPLAQAAICYQPKPAELSAIAVAEARDQHLRLANAEARLLVDLVDGDQSLMRREIEKLSIYLDASADRPRSVTAEAIQALGAASHDEDIGSFVNVVMGGKTAQLPEQLARAASVGVADIRLIRSLSNRVQLLARLRADVDGGANMKSVTDSVFFKDRDAVAAQLRIWDAVRIARLNDRLIACERALKAPSTPGPMLLRQLAVDIAHQAARTR